VLNDDSYNANRRVSTGNPYRGQLNELMNLGVQLELCGATAKGNHWGNENLLSGIKVNVNAMVRLTQLEQQGYTMIYQYRGYRVCPPDTTREGQGDFMRLRIGRKDKRSCHL
jgi:hypothetical protein